MYNYTSVLASTPDSFTCLSAGKRSELHKRLFVPTKPLPARLQPLQQVYTYLHCTTNRTTFQHMFLRNQSLLITPNRSSKNLLLISPEEHDGYVQPALQMTARRSGVCAL